MPLKNLKQIACIAAVLIGWMPLSAAGKMIFISDTTKLIEPFVVADVTGRKIDVAVLKNKVVFINFWALTCAPCKAELPTINDLAEHYKNDTNFVVLAIDLDHKLADDVRYFDEQKIKLNVYMPMGVIPQQLFMGVLPTTAVIAKGKIVLLRQEEGKYDSPSFFQFVDSLLTR